MQDVNLPARSREEAIYRLHSGELPMSEGDPQRSAGYTEQDIRSCRDESRAATYPAKIASLVCHAQE
jgi:hypothetical protein